MSSSRFQVLELYRRIFRLSRRWVSACQNEEATQQERNYIVTEAARLFRNNKNEKDQNKIKEYITEAETRIALAEHYRTPYPRMWNIPQNVLAFKGVSKMTKVQRRAIRQATPNYFKSLGEENIPDKKK